MDNEKFGKLIDEIENRKPELDEIQIQMKTIHLAEIANKKLQENKWLKGDERKWESVTIRNIK